MYCGGQQGRRGPDAMGKKYVIELEDVSFVNDLPFPDERLYRVKGFKSLVFDKTGLEKLTPLNTEKELAKAKQEGAEEAWELARWAFSEATDAQVKDVYPEEWQNGGYHRIASMSWLEAKKKYDAWAAGVDNVKVGDEVENIGTKQKGVVWIVGDDYVEGFYTKGTTVIGGFSWYKTWIRKTGRYFPELFEMLKKIGEKNAK
jgi:hypothetical protein